MFLYVLSIPIERLDDDLDLVSVMSLLEADATVRQEKNEREKRSGSVTNIASAKKIRSMQKLTSIYRSE